MIAETVTISGSGGDAVEAYSARPLRPGPIGGVVVIHHAPGLDDPTREIVRRFASAGYNAVCPNLYWREAPGLPPEEAAGLVRGRGGVPDDRLVGDVAGAAGWLKGLTSSNEKVGTIGYCSGGRQSFLSACRLQLDAAVDCYGAFVAFAPPESMGWPVKPIIGEAVSLSCPLLGLFGAEDTHPSPDETAKIEEALADHGKTWEFHTYPGAGHAFFHVARNSYNPEAAVDGWKQIWTWFGRYLGES